MCRGTCFWPTKVGVPWTPGLEKLVGSLEAPGWTLSCRCGNSPERTESDLPVMAEWLHGPSPPPLVPGKPILVSQPLRSTHPMEGRAQGGGCRPSRGWGTACQGLAQKSTSRCLKIACYSFPENATVLWTPLLFKFRLRVASLLSILGWVRLTLSHVILSVSCLKLQMWRLKHRKIM